MSAAAKAAVRVDVPQPAPGRHRPNLRLVRQPRRVAPRLPFVAVVVGLLAVGLVGLLLLSMQRAQASFHQAALAQTDAALGDQQQALQRLVEQDGDPAVLGARAAAIGMVPEATPGYLTPGGRVIGAVPSGAPTPTRGAPVVDGVVVAGVAVVPAPHVSPSGAAAATTSAVPATRSSAAPTAGRTAGHTAGHTTAHTTSRTTPRATPTGRSSR